MTEQTYVPLTCQICWRVFLSAQREDPFCPQCWLDVGLRVRGRSCLADQSDLDED